MRSHLLIAFFIIILIGVSQSQFLSLRKGLRLLLPQDILTLIQSLTPEQVKFLEKADSFDQTMGVKGLLTAQRLFEKINVLTPSAKEYVRDFVTSIATLDEKNEKENLKKLIKDFDKLDEKTQDILNALFPEVVAGLRSFGIHSLAGLDIEHF